MRRAWTYLQERFPLPAHGPLVFAFAGGVACASAALRGAPGPGWPAVLVAALVALGFFFQLRVADEWKDAEADRRHQPERPVPRGLVTLRELTVAALAVAAVQLGLAWWLRPPLVLVLGVVWAFGALMTVEFGVRDWLRARPVAVLLSHALIVPLIDAFAVSADVLGNGGGYPEGVGWLIGVSFYGGMAVEIGRKVWSPADERRGVASYSGLWGLRPALAVWGLVVALSAACGIFVLRAVADSSDGQATVDLASVELGLAVAAVVVVGAAALAMRGARAGRGRVVEALAGVWTLALYLSIGPLSLWLARA